MLFLCMNCVGAGFADSQENRDGNLSSDNHVLRNKIEQTLESNLKHRLLSAERNAAWQIVHGSVAYGETLPLEVHGEKVLAIDYLFDGGTVDGWDLSLGPVLPATGRPGVIAPMEAGSYVGQGHTDQWIGYFSQIPLSLDRKILVDGQSVLLRDWVRQAQWEVPDNPYREYSWTLIALTNFFPDEQEWIAKDGKTWTLEPLVRHEAQQDLGESPCGGMHRLMGLAHAVRYRQRLKGSMDGGWLLAKQVVDESISAAKRFQNSDGSFSTNYTVRGGTSGDLGTCIGATGHTLEFLSYALDANELQSPWMEKAVSRLCDMLKATERVDLECGGTYHGLAGLKLYHQRRFGQKP